MKRIFLLIIITALGTFILTPPEAPETALQQPPEQVTVEAPKPVEKPPEQARPQITWRDNPQNCEDTTRISAEPPFDCLPPLKGSSPVRVPNESVGTGSCETEVHKYDWPVSTAVAIMNGESGGRHWVVNNNPATGDYSIGCFQVNIRGSLAYSRPSEAELKNPAVNVAWAYNKYVAEGRTFCTTGGWYNTCVKLGFM